MTLLDVVLASKNAKKMSEMQAILAEAAPSVRLASAEWDDVEETAPTFAGNALAKAAAVHAATGLVAVADDSGLEVDALGGAPGVLSARYAGAHGDDGANNRLLVERMRGAADRRCRFRCAIAIVGPGIETVIERTVEGTLRDAPAGAGGFGYDPLFEPLGWHETFAEVVPVKKAATSHRGKAMRSAAEALARYAAGRRPYEGDDDVDITLTQDETDALRNVLSQYMSDLRMEIVDTDNHEYRANLKAEQALLVGILGRLGGATTPES